MPRSQSPCVWGYELIDYPSYIQPCTQAVTEHKCGVIYLLLHDRCPRAPPRPYPSLTFARWHWTSSIVGRQVAEERILDDRLERSRCPGGENQAMLQAADQHERPQVERLTVGTCNIRREWKDITTTKIKSIERLCEWKSASLCFKFMLIFLLLFTSQFAWAIYVKIFRRKKQQHQNWCTVQFTACS